MIPLLILLSAVAVSLLVTRIAAAALEHTGLSRDVARFQARSAATGTGFTTDEAEALVSHPVRRRILLLLMMVQSAGLITVISTLVISFVQTESPTQAVLRGTVLVLGLGALVGLARSRWVDRQLSRAIDWALERYTDLDVTDYYSLLHLEGEFTVSRLPVTADSWLAGRKLEELELPEEGVLVLAIEREDGTYLGAPRGRYTIHGGDTLILYGRAEGLDELYERLAGPAGDRAHEAAAEAHRDELRRQDRAERARSRRRSGEEGAGDGLPDA